MVFVVLSYNTVKILPFITLFKINRSIIQLNGKDIVRDHIHVGYKLYPKRYDFYRDFTKSNSKWNPYTSQTDIFMPKMPSYPRSNSHGLCKLCPNCIYICGQMELQAFRDLLIIAQFLIFVLLYLFMISDFWTRKWPNYNQWSSFALLTIGMISHTTIPRPTKRDIGLNNNSPFHLVGRQL